MSDIVIYGEDSMDSNVIEGQIKQVQSEISHVQNEIKQAQTQLKQLETPIKLIRVSHTGKQYLFDTRSGAIKAVEPNIIDTIGQYEVVSVLPVYDTYQIYNGDPTPTKFTLAIRHSDGSFSYDDMYISDQIYIGKYDPAVVLYLISKQYGDKIMRYHDSIIEYGSLGYPIKLTTAVLNNINCNDQKIPNISKMIKRIVNDTTKETYYFDAHHAEVIPEDQIHKLYKMFASEHHVNSFKKINFIERICVSNQRSEDIYRINLVDAKGQTVDDYVPIVNNQFAITEFDPRFLLGSLKAYIVETNNLIPSEIFTSPKTYGIHPSDVGIVIDVNNPVNNPTSTTSTVNNITSTTSTVNNPVNQPVNSIFKSTDNMLKYMQMLHVSPLNHQMVVDMQLGREIDISNINQIYYSHLFSNCKQAKQVKYIKSMVCENRTFLVNVIDSCNKNDTDVVTINEYGAFSLGQYDPREIIKYILKNSSSPYVTSIISKPHSRTYKNAPIIDKIEDKQLIPIKQLKNMSKHAVNVANDEMELAMTEDLSDLDDYVDTNWEDHEITETTTLPAPLPDNIRQEYKINNILSDMMGEGDPNRIISYDEEKKPTTVPPLKTSKPVTIVDGVIIPQAELDMQMRLLDNYEQKKKIRRLDNINNHDLFNSTQVVPYKDRTSKMPIDEPSEELRQAIELSLKSGDRPVTPKVNGINDPEIKEMNDIVKQTSDVISETDRVLNETKSMSDIDAAIRAVELGRMKNTDTNNSTKQDGKDTTPTIQPTTQPTTQPTQPVPVNPVNQVNNEITEDLKKHYYTVKSRLEYRLSNLQAERQRIQTEVEKTELQLFGVEKMLAEIEDRYKLHIKLANIPPVIIRADNLAD